MKKTWFTDEQIAFAPRQAEQGTSVEESTRRLGVGVATFCRRKKRFGGMGGGSAPAQATGGAEPQAQGLGGGSD
jgi:hypothetical protein